MGAQAYITSVINNSKSAVVDFKNQSFSIDSQVIMTTSSVVKEVKNLTLDITGGNPVNGAMFQVPRFTDNTHPRIFRNIRFTQSGGSGLTMMSNKSAFVKFQDLSFEGVDTGFHNLGGNLCTFVGCRFRNCDIGLIIDKNSVDYPSSNGYRGNACQFFGCGWMDCPIAAQAVAAAYETNASPGNATFFSGCTFESNGATADHAMIDWTNTENTRFSNCRWELNVSNAITASCVHFKVDNATMATGSSVAQRFSHCVFSMSASAGSGTCITADSDVTDVSVTNSTFSTSASGSGTVAYTSGPVTGRFNRNGPNRSYGRLYQTAVESTAQEVGTSWEEAVFTSTALQNPYNDFAKQGEGRIQYTGAAQKSFKVTYSLCTRADLGGDARTCDMTLYKYDDSAASASAVSESRVTSGVVTNNFHNENTGTCFVTLDTSDYLYINLQSSATSDWKLGPMSIMVEEIG